MDLELPPGLVAKMVEEFDRRANQALAEAGIGECQRCHRPIKVGQPYMPRIPMLAGWRGFDHQHCPPTLRVVR